MRYILSREVRVLDLWFYVVIGFLQGVFEWLPVSSKSVLMLFAGLAGDVSVLESYFLALTLQGSTVVSAAVFFRRVLLRLFRQDSLLEFLVVSTVVTGVLGVPIYVVVQVFLRGLEFSVATLLIGLLLLFQYFVRRGGRGGFKTAENVSLVDSVLFGVAQSLAVLPGVSRSGATIAALVFMGYGLEDAMKLSFLASIPANLGGALLAFSTSNVSVTEPFSGLMLAFAVSAVVGLLTIKYLMSFSLKHSQELILLMSLITIATGLSWLVLGRLR
jgi:undecaprenyl-diphosphatase